jgi:perosamine synthetase
MIPVAVPYIAKNSIKYVTSALEKGAISGLYGEDLPIFERAFADFIGVEHAIACSNGTTAIHLPLAARGIGPGDEVLVSSLTNMATFFAVIYCGATPIPVDVDLDTLNMSVSDAAAKITPRTKAILVVHLFGQPAEMPALMTLANEHGLDVYEDCAESHGATIDGRQSGSFGLAGCFSFFANKIVNTGEGGMVTTNDAALAERMRSIKSLAFGKTEKFLHEGIGYNYRMDNLKGALGRAQMEEVDSIVAQKIKMGQVYDELLADEELLVLPAKRPNAVNVYWMYHVRLVDALAAKRNELIARLASAGMETRPGFVSYTLQPFADHNVVAANPCPTAEKVSYSTLYIPSSQTIDLPAQTEVVSLLRQTLRALT